MILSYLVRNNSIIKIIIAKLNITKIIKVEIKAALISKNKIISKDKWIKYILCLVIWSYIMLLQLFVFKTPILLSK